MFTPSDSTRHAAATALDHVQSERLRVAIAELATFGGRSDGGVSRQTLTEVDLRSRRHLVTQARAMGCEVSIDDCANLFFRRPGLTEAPAILTGSHGDTQPVGGKLDGAYGVLAGLELIQALNDAGLQTQRAIEVVAWTNEEGSRFGPGCMGSSAFVDPSQLAGFRAVLDADKVSFGQAVDLALQDMPDVPRRALKQPIGAYLELHIEQGPVLERAGVALGVVNGIQSVRWFRVKATGVAAHAGTTPMEVRADAMAASIEVAHQLQTEAARRRASHLRMTMGRWVVSPNSINTIPGEVEFTIDIRCVDAQVLTEFEALIRRTLTSYAWPGQMTLTSIFERQPTRFAAPMLALVRQACEHTSQKAAQAAPIDLTSGAFHDAMYLADHCPTGMIFVPSKSGISHNAAEETDHSELLLGAQALAYAVTALATD